MLDFLNKAKDWALGILGVLAALFLGLFLFEKKQREVQEALKDNAETKGKVDQIDNQIKSIEDATKAKENENVSKEDLLDFLNNKSDK